MTLNWRALWLKMWLSKLQMTMQSKKRVIGRMA